MVERGVNSKDLPGLLAEFGVPKISHPAAERAFWIWVGEQEGRGVDTSHWWNGNGNGNRGNILRAFFVMRFSVNEGRVTTERLDEFSYEMEKLLPEDDDELFSLIREITERFT